MRTASRSLDGERAGQHAALAIDRQQPDCGVADLRRDDKKGAPAGPQACFDSRDKVMSRSDWMIGYENPRIGQPRCLFAVQQRATRAPAVPGCTLEVISGHAGSLA